MAEDVAGADALRELRANSKMPKVRASAKHLCIPAKSIQVGLAKVFETETEDGGNSIAHFGASRLELPQDV